MQSLWRAMALVWLGGIASPALAPDAVPFDNVNEERPLESNAAADQIGSVELHLGATESPASGQPETSSVVSRGGADDDASATEQ